MECQGVFRGFVEADGAGAEGAGFAVDAALLPLEGGTDPVVGTVRWRTLICSDRGPSRNMVLGVAEFEPFGTLSAHRHVDPEFYFGLEGSGIVTIDGEEHRIGAGVAIFIPGDAEHKTVAGPEGLRFTYGFAAGRFADIEYRFTGS